MKLNRLLEATSVSGAPDLLSDGAVALEIGAPVLVEPAPVPVASLVAATVVELEISKSTCGESADEREAEAEVEAEAEETLEKRTWIVWLARGVEEMGACAVDEVEVGGAAVVLVLEVVCAGAADDVVGVCETAWTAAC